MPGPSSTRMRALVGLFVLAVLGVVWLAGVRVDPVRWCVGGHCGDAAVAITSDVADVPPSCIHDASCTASSPAPVIAALAVLVAVGVSIASLPARLRPMEQALLGSPHLLRLYRPPRFA